jgi:hypothetical protein
MAIVLEFEKLPGKNIINNFYDAMGFLKDLFCFI